jgi:hypothetical protein
MVIDWNKAWTCPITMSPILLANGYYQLTLVKISIRVWSPMGMVM